MFMTFAALACSRPTYAAGDLPKPVKDLPAPTTQPGATTQPAPQTAVFAGGCFWCIEAVYQQLNGVVDVTSGYAGGTKETATYEQVSAGDTGHAEAVRINYDPARISYGELLRVFFTVHDPTTKDAQGPDHGHQYRSAIFYADEPQKQVAEAYIRQLQEAKAFDKPIVTTLEKLEAFYPAEKYHQNYVNDNPYSGYVRQIAIPKVKKVREKFKEEVKAEAGKKE